MRAYIREYIERRGAWVIYDVALYGFALYGLYAAVYFGY